MTSIWPPIVNLCLRQSKIAFWFGLFLSIVLVATSLQYQQVQGCDYFQGRWIFDYSYPIYNASTCPFIGQGFDCVKNGRPDREYLKYRWQPNGCDLPRFNGRDFLERYRGKKIMFVGDSLSNNMWQSLTCMLHSAVPNSKYTISQTTFSFSEYGVTVIFMKNGFLVDVVKERVGRVLKLDTISTGKLWKGVDVLIFNTNHWWTHTGRSKTWDYFQIGNKLLKEMDRMEAYKIGLTTWAKWIDANIHPSQTKVFFQGVSPNHANGSEWNPRARNCRAETKPVKGSKYPGPNNPGKDVVKSVLSKMAKPVYLLDITLLTQLRKDGHPSTYTGRGIKFVDCSHWCLAGVPDTWNEILHAALLNE